jgi:K+:H+ antiporter
MITVTLALSSRFGAASTGALFHAARVHAILAGRLRYGSVRTGAVRLDVVPALTVDLAVIGGLAWVLGGAARRLGQPAVIGEIIGGILLGPTLLHGEITGVLFPAGVRPPLTALANIGVCAFMFLIGLRLDRRLLHAQGRVTGVVALSAIVVPFGLGALLAVRLTGTYPSRHALGFVVFLGTAMSMTAFPVLARILTDRGLFHTPVGGLALACAAVDDVLAWSLLAVAMALSGAGTGAGRIVLALPFAAVMLGAVRPLLARLAARHMPASGLANAGVLAAMAAGLSLSALATGWMGLHSIFGAFLFGVIMPRGEPPDGTGDVAGAGIPARAGRPLRWIERICSVLLLPVFFMVAGLKVNLSRVDGAALGELGLILLVAIGGKFGGGFAGARASGARARHSAVLGILLNARGLTELIVLTVGLQTGLLDQRLYSLMVVMAVVTTALTGVLLRLVHRGGLLDAPVVPGGVAGAVPGRPLAAHLQQPGGPVPVPGIGGEQFAHARVVHLLPDQRPAHDRGQVVVADRQGVGVTDGPLADLGGGPRPDPGQRLQPPVRLGRGHRGGLLQLLGHPCRADDRPGADQFHPGTVPLPGRDADPGPRRGADPHPRGRRPRGRVAEPEQQQPPGTLRLRADHLLLKHGGDQRLEHPAGPADPQRVVPPGHLGQQRVHRLEAGRVIGGSQQAGQGAEEPRRARAPRGRVHGDPPVGPGGLRVDPHRGRAVRRERGAPRGPVLVDPVCGITPATPVHAQRPGPVERERRLPLPGQRAR